MLTLKKLTITRVALLAAYALLRTPETNCSSVSLPTREQVALFKAIAPKMVKAIPDKALEPSHKDKLSQVIIAGSDVFDLALAIESGELTTEFKEKLNVIRNEFKVLNAKLVAEGKKLQELKTELKNASTEQKARLLQEQTALMLDMFNNMADPMLNVSMAFKDLNGMLVAKLLQVLELIPPIKPYLTVGSGIDQIMLSRFMSVKLQEMIMYTQQLKKIGANLKMTYNELQADLLKCKNNLLQKSYQTLAAQKPLLIPREERPAEPMELEREQAPQPMETEEEEPELD